jgi:SAM-dependent methyltransferase
MDTSQTHGNLPILHTVPGKPEVSYGRARDGEPHFWAEVHRLLDSGAKRICDVGGGAKPILSHKVIDTRSLDYTVLDVSREQLDEAVGYRTFQASILDELRIDELVSEGGRFDGVVSRWTAEHIPDGRGFHKQVLRLLRPGGVAVHFFPTLYTLPFVANRLLGTKSSRAVLFRVDPNRVDKFPAYYSWCRGPSASQVRRLQGIGYEIDRYVGFFGHTFYQRIRPLHHVQEVLTRTLVDHPFAPMTSFALVVLRRPN